MFSIQISTLEINTRRCELISENLWKKIQYWFCYKRLQFVSNSVKSEKFYKTLSLLTHFQTHTHTRFLQSLSCCAKTQEFQFFCYIRNPTQNLFRKIRKVLERMSGARQTHIYINWHGVTLQLSNETALNFKIAAWAKK